MQHTALQQKKTRFDWLDAVKAFAMLLVIFGHLGLNMVRYYQIYAGFIKLPLFFAASGFVFNPKKADDVIGFIKSRVQRILLPYFYLCLTICVFNLLFYRQDWTVWLKESAYNVFTGKIYMWFLPVLFLCNLLMMAVFKLFKEKPLPILLTAAVSLVLGYVLLPEKHILFNVNETLIAYPFCIFGYYIRHYILQQKQGWLTASGVAAVGLYGALPVIYKLLTGYFNYINMNENHYSAYPLDLLIAFCGVWGVFALFRCLKYPKPVIWFGQNTMFYYAYHIPACALLVWVLQKTLLTDMTADSMRQNPLLYSTVTVVTLVLLAPLCLLINRYVPFLVGMRKQKSIDGKK